MRRSKSNPAKYARNYRSISQRRMTAGLDGDGGDDDDEEAKEMRRLQKLLRESQDHLKRHQDYQQQHQQDEDDRRQKQEDAASSSSSRKKKRKKRAEGCDGAVAGVKEQVETSPRAQQQSHQEDGDNPSRGTSILSSELVDEIRGCSYGGGDGDGDNPENPLVVLPSSKKKKAKQSSRRVELTPEEIKEAKKLQKDTERKLQQLKDRSGKKKRRKELYAKLERSALTESQMGMLGSSSTLGKRLSKREELAMLLRKERAGMRLTDEERSLLYRDRDGAPPPPGNREDDAGPLSATATADAADAAKPASSSSLSQPVGPAKSKTAKRKKKDAAVGSPADAASGKKPSGGNSGQKMIVHVDDPETSSDEEEDPITTGKSTKNASENSDDSKKKEPEPKSDDSSNDNKPLSFAAQMMASLTRLKVKTEEEQEQKKKADAAKKESSDGGAFKIPEPSKKRYLPTEPAVLQTAATLGLAPAREKERRGRLNNVVDIRRPADVETWRYELPVSQMEYEVMDAIRNNDVTIICGETGSGKSTQVPQFLYQAGLTQPLGGGSGGGTGGGTGGSDGGNKQETQEQQTFMIGVTQPRRVAAVSTAKRVCYEMGMGNGQSVPNHRADGCPVAYQTRYETAGLGSSTQIKFMTDGILLQEIRADLLLRKYSVICLDEAHERNLNTDVLIGLLSKSIPLRKQAAKEDPANIVPLKLVIMSATLKVKDFTENDKLFSAATEPAVVTIPGRTFPVTIHHSKATELEEYEDIAFQKICKIHRKLPQGGILVFLTGKQEILRMVNRLRRALAPRVSSNSAPRDVSVPIQNEGETEDALLRELDDEELDADLFRSDDHGYGDKSETFKQEDSPSSEECSDGRPQHVRVLPLYSLLSSEDQAKVFTPAPEGHRLIVIATNIAETSITIPGISYVVDCGRQKCRNYSAGTGVASYDVMWISKAAADQRAGRAGRTGPGHCYRLYSSTMYSRHMDSFALPEVLTRPLEDVLLSMKAMNVLNIADFPFPTPPPQAQLDPALRLLADIGCLDLSSVEERGGDGEITRLGRAVANLPIGVRYGKVLLVAAQAGVLDYAIATVAALSESNPFTHSAEIEVQDTEEASEADDEEDNVNNDEKKTDVRAKRHRWVHKGGDALAATLAVGAYAYAGRGLSGKAQQQACRVFCEQNGLNSVVMERIHKMRSHLARLARARLGSTVEDSMAARTGGFTNSMSPPNKLQERLLCQAIASGFLDKVAMLAPLGSIPGEHPFSLRTAYLGCSSRRKEPLFLDRNSVLYSRDSRVLPQWICFESLLRKTLKDGTPIAVMKSITPIDVSWLGPIAVGSQLLQLGDPRPTPLPVYDGKRDAILCSVTTKFGLSGWEIPPVKLVMRDALRKASPSAHFTPEDSFRWFGRFLLEGKVISELQSLGGTLNDSPSVITATRAAAQHSKKVMLLVSALSNAGIDSAAKLRRHWAEVDDKFLFRMLKLWVKTDRASDAKTIWIDAVRCSVSQWREQAS